MSASGSGRPCPCEPQTQLWTLKTEGHTVYSYCDTAEGTKQTVHLYYWFRVTTVFLDDFNGTFSAYLRGFRPEKFLLCSSLQKERPGSEGTHQNTVLSCLQTSFLFA